MFCIKVTTKLSIVYRIDCCIRLLAQAYGWKEPAEQALSLWMLEVSMQGIMGQTGSRYGY